MAKNRRTRRLTPQMGVGGTAESDCRFATAVNHRADEPHGAAPLPHRARAMLIQPGCVFEMSELDVAKEQIAYLKFWLGVMVVTDISLSGWLISNAGSTSLRLLVSCCLAVIAITTGIALLHRRIERQIQALRGL